MTRLPNLHLVRKISGAITYQFRVDDKDLGWALCTVNDATGELAVCSDWGNWQNLWGANPKHLGAENLTAFIANRCANDCHYLANKLTSPEQRNRFDPHETVRAFSRRLCERRLALGREYERMRWTTDPWHLDTFHGTPLTRELAREIWDRLHGELSDTRDTTLFVERFMQIDGYWHVSEEPWEQTQDTPDFCYTVLLESILPALVKACQDTVAERERERSSQEATASP